MSLKNIGWIGTGIMGKSMCSHLMAAGYSLMVYNRTKSKADDLVSKGATFLQPEEIASKCDALFLMVGYPQDLDDLMFSKQKLIDHLKPGTIVIDHTTSSPALAKNIYEKLKEKSVSSLDAPVTGGDKGALNGTLTTFVGGDKEAFDKVLPLLEKYSKKTEFMGISGNGQSTKLVNQTLLANALMGVCEGILFAQKAGLDPAHVLQSVSAGAAASFQLNYFGPQILERNFDPGFYVEHFVKDLELVLEESKRMNLSLPSLSFINQMYRALISQGGARLGSQGLFLVLEKLNNMSPK